MKPNKKNDLVEKLDAFIRKYYKNQLIKGAIYWSTLTLLLFLTIIFLEYVGRYQSQVRGLLLFSFIVGSTVCLFKYVFVPLAKLFNLGERLDHPKAAVIIGQHFPNVKDKLLNVIQLENTLGNNDQSLLRAAILQKTIELKPVSFVSAIDFRNNLKKARFLAIPFVLYALSYIIAPSMIAEGGTRVINYSSEFKPVAPFNFILQNTSLLAEQFTDYEIVLHVEGKEMPNEVFIDVEGNLYKMRREENNQFSYVVTNITKKTKFQFTANEFNSPSYLLNVFAKPSILQYKAKLSFPTYINKPSQWIDNPTDLTVPAGTTIQWEFTTQNADAFELSINGEFQQLQELSEGRFGITKRITKGGSYFMRPIHASVAKPDSIQYLMNVVPDAYPSIVADEKVDSLADKNYFFIGDANDDYGIKRLAFVYQIKRFEQSLPEPSKMNWIPIEEKAISARFYYQMDLTQIGLQPGDELTYYFEVWDNDGIRGSKSTKSSMKQLRRSSEKELEEKSEQGSKALKSKMEQAMADSKKLQKEMKDLERQLQEKKELTWEDKKKMDKLLEQQKKLAQQLAEIKKENAKLNKEEAEYKKQEEQILQKQEQLEKMFNELMDEEMKKLIKEMERLIQQQNKEQIKEEVEKMKLSNKDVEKELDRMLEQYKKLELEKKLGETTEKLDELSKKQDDLSKKAEEVAKEKNNTEKKEKEAALQQEQKKLSEEFKEATEDLKKIEEENKKLEEPTELEKTDEEQQEIEKEQQGSEKDLEKGDSKKAAEKQKKAADKMKEMSEKIKEKQKKEEQEEQELNEQALREILENAIQLSKDQESLMDKMGQINGYNPQFIEAAQTQKNIRDDAKIIEDSLLALSKRVAEIRTFVNREVSKLNGNLDRSVKGYGDRNFPEIRTRQQYSMTHANNLAVMLSDILKQMQDEMQGDGSGKGKSKPKSSGKGKSGKSSGKPKTMGELKKAQEELNKQLREGLNKQQGKGEKPGEGEKKPGQQGKPGGNGGMGSQEFARMAAQQQAIRQQMQQMLNKMGTKEKEGLGGQQKLNEMQQLMEQTEKELYNKQLSNQLIQRQQDILTRLLESEKAEKKQDQDTKREAEQAKEKPTTTPPNFEQYLKQKEKEKELLETIPAELQPYYKEKAKDYFNKIGKQ